MATAYPGSLDTVSSQLRTDITASTDMNASGYEHHTMHVNVNGAVVKLETKLGTDSSNSAPSTGAVLIGTGAGASAWDTSPTFVDTVTVGGVVDITDTTDSSDATGDTGALRCEGGASIAKKLYVGTDLDVDGTTNLDAVDIDGAVDMATTLTLGGNADFNGDLDVDGTTNLDAVDIDGNVQIDGTVTVGVDDTGYDVKFFAATAGDYFEYSQTLGNVVIETPSTGTNEASLTANTGILRIGESAGEHLAIDGNEIMAKSDATTAGDLHFQNNGGTVKFGNANDLTSFVVKGPASFSGEIAAASLDISGNIDVDGTTNLDVVDIDGAVDMASTLTIAAGSAGTPAIHFSGDTDTGIYRNGANILGFVAEGAVRQTVHPAGTVLNTCAAGTGTDIEINGLGVLVQNSSSLRYKNVASVNMADHLTANMIDSLEPKMFSFKSDSDNHPMVGLIAEDCHTVSPFLAVHNQDGESETTDKNALISLLIIALKDARTRITALES